MWTAIITAESGKTLDSKAIDQLYLDWQGRHMTELAASEAVMLTLSHEPDDFAARWQAWQQNGVDLNLLASAPSPKRILVADMDGTMIEQECLDELAEMAGVGEYVKQVTARAMNGELDFEAALKQRVALLKNQPAEIINQVISEKISLMPGGKTLLATMRANGGYSALVSGGFTPFTEYVAEQLGFDEHHGNDLIIANDVLIGAVAEPIKGKATKQQICRTLSHRLAIPLSEMMAIGDGANDLDMLRIVGMGVAFHGKPAVAAAAQWRINHGDLTALLYLQGYRKSDFINA